MPLYNLPLQQNQYKGFDIAFMERQVNAKQDRADKVRGAWSEMLQKQADLGYRDEEARQKQLSDQTAIFEKITDRYKGNLSLAYPDILGAIETAKTSPYWNLNKTQMDAVANRQKQIDEYGVTAIDLSQNIDTPLWTKEGWMNPNAIKSEVIKADDYRTNLENQVANLAAFSEELTGDIKAAKGSPEYYEVLKTKIKSLPYERLQAIANDPNVQDAFLANNPTALRDTRQIDGSGITYADMFSDRNKLGEWILGNIQDKQQYEYTQDKQFLTNQTYMANYNSALRQKEQETKSKQEYDNAVKLKTMEITGSLLPTDINTTIVIGKKDYDVTKEVYNTSKNKVTTLSNERKDLEKKLRLELGLRPGQPITSDHISKILNTSKDEKYKTTLQGLATQYAMNEKNLNEATNDAKSTETLIKSTESQLFKNWKKDNKEDYNDALKLYGNEQAVKNFFMKTTEANYQTELDYGISWLGNATSKFLHRKGIPNSFTTDEELLTENLALAISDYKKEKLESGLDLNKEVYSFQYMNDKHPLTLLTKKINNDIIPNSSNPVALFTDANNKSLINRKINGQSYTDFLKENTVNVKVTNEDGTTSVIPKPAYEVKVALGKAGMWNVMLVPTDEAKKKFNKTYLLGEGYYMGNNDNANNAILNEIFSSYNASLGETYNVEEGKKQRDFNLIAAGGLTPTGRLIKQQEGVFQYNMDNNATIEPYNIGKLQVGFEQGLPYLVKIDEYGRPQKEFIERANIMERLFKEEGFRVLEQKRNPYAVDYTTNPENKQVKFTQVDTDNNTETEE